MYGRKKISKIGVGINKIEGRKEIEKINETVSWYFKKIKNDKFLAKLRRERERELNREMKEKTLLLIP